MFYVVFLVNFFVAFFSEVSADAAYVNVETLFCEEFKKVEEKFKKIKGGSGLDPLISLIEKEVGLEECLSKIEEIFEIKSKYVKKECKKGLGNDLGFYSFGGVGILLIGLNGLHLLEKKYNTLLDVKLLYNLLIKYSVQIGFLCLLTPVLFKFLLGEDINFKWSALRSDLKVLLYKTQEELKYIKKQVIESGKMNSDLFSFTYEFQKYKLKDSSISYSSAIKETDVYKKKIEIRDISFYKMLVEFIQKDNSISDDERKKVIKIIQEDFGVREFVSEVVSKDKLLNIAPMHGKIYKSFMEERARCIRNYFSICDSKKSSDEIESPNMLFYGAPGTGKSEIMGQIVNEFVGQHREEVYFFTIRPSDFPTIEYFKIFKEQLDAWANMAKNTVVKLDELDCFLNVNRNKSDGNSQGIGVLAEMLPMLEDFVKTRKSVVFISATNFLENKEGGTDMRLNCLIFLQEKRLLINIWN